MISLVSNVADMTPDWFSSVIQSAGMGQGSRVESVELEPFGDGVMTSMVRATVRYDAFVEGAPTSLLVKFPSADEGNRQIAEVMGLYELEVLFYRDIADRLPDLAVPRCYFAEINEASGVFNLVLEDCSAVTEPGTHLPTLTPAQCTAALHELSNLQAPLWDSPILSEIGWLNDNSRTYSIFDAVPSGLQPFLERFGDRLESEHVQLFEQALPKAGEWVRSWQGPRVLQHGEFRSGNILLGTTDDAKPVTVIDFQTVRVGEPGVDLAYFMGGSMPAEDRRQMEKAVIRSYHEKLIESGVKHFSWDDCWNSYRKGAMYGVYLLVGMAGQVESSERNDRVILGLTKQFAEMAIDLDSMKVAGFA